ncbi:MAG TPA: STAS domain-containing protein [Streptosporangiaceae bacterium]
MTADTCPVRWAGRQATVTLPAEIDILNGQLVRETLEQVLASEAAVVVADMTATTFCASEGLHILIRTHLQAAAGGVALRLAAPGPVVRRVMELTAADQVLDIYPSMEDALAGRRTGTGGG